uniref:Pectin lyase n=1 Tax=Penicillium expansum TaxID=27334 RepID=Q6QEG1_PENEN|nr:pectin lyase [Penicillium expansum]
MKIAAIFAALAVRAAAVGVTGAAEGFAKGVTGGGSATPVYPSTTAELVSYLGDSSPRVIILTKTFDFTGTEGTTSATGCALLGVLPPLVRLPSTRNNWCQNYEPNAPSTSVNTTTPRCSRHNRQVQQVHRWLRQRPGVIKGRTSAITRTIKTPKYVLGRVTPITHPTTAGHDLDRITVTTRPYLSPAHRCSAPRASKRVTISNSFINGASDYSATCNGYHYWGVYLDGSSDLVTMKGNQQSTTPSDVPPRFRATPLLHACQQLTGSRTPGHAFEIGRWWLRPSLRVTCSRTLLLLSRLLLLDSCSPPPIAPPTLSAALTSAVPASSMDSDLPEPSMAVLILHSWPTLLERTLLLLPLTLPLLPVLTLTLVRVSL